MFSNAFRTAIPLTAAAVTTAALLPPVDAKASAVNLPSVKADIANVISKSESDRSDGTSLTGTFVRLAWHCAGTFALSDKTGGSNGARMRFNPEASWGANAGLGPARAALESVKAKHPDISYADLYTLAGVVAVEEAAGPAIPFRLGREDFEDGSTSPPDGRLPAADKGSMPRTAQHIRDVFSRMGFTDREAVALLGAHALGRCHTDASGYWGPWTNAETTMSNEYFRLLVEEEWTIKKTHNGKKWTGPEQYEDKTGNLMMLPSDIALIQDAEFAKVVLDFAKDEDKFFKEFSAAFSRLLELGVPFPKAWWKFW